MKRHLCRHCGLALDTYAELRHHVKSHSTPSWDQHRYSVAPPAAAVPPSDQDKKAKYACKCDATFGRWDDLQHHVRSVCRLSRRSSSSSCSRKTPPSTRARNVDGISKEPPSPKRSNMEDTPPHHHPLIDHKDTRINRTPPVQVRLHNNHARHDRSRAPFEEHVPGTDQRVQD